MTNNYGLRTYLSAQQMTTFPVKGHCRFHPRIAASPHIAIHNPSAAAAEVPFNPIILLMDQGLGFNSNSPGNVFLRKILMEMDNSLSHHQFPTKNHLPFFSSIPIEELLG